jgi:hypothetical protein
LIGTDNQNSKFNGVIADFVFFSGAMSRQEAYDYLRAPYQIYSPIQRRIYVPSAGGGAVATGTGIAVGQSQSPATGTLQALAAATATGIGATDYLAQMSVDGVVTATGIGSASNPAQALHAAPATATGVGVAHHTAQMLQTAHAVAVGFGFAWAVDATVGLSTRYARPIADVSAGAWAASSGSDLYAMLDEEAASDADYVRTDAASTFEVRLAPLDPSAATAHTLRWRVPDGFSPVGSLTITLRAGVSTEIAVVHSGTVTADTDYSYTLTAGEVAAISDYTDLRVRVASS